MMDKKDLQILQVLAERGTSSPNEIQKHTDIPKSTVHYRLSQLREEGVIKNELYDIDLSKIGLSLTVISEVYAEFKEGYHNSVGKQLAELEGVNQVYFIMGDVDFIVNAHVVNRDMVESLIESYEAIEGIKRTSSKFVITTVKNEPRPLNDFDDKTLESALKNREL